MSIQIQMFMGHILTKELKLHLKQSSHWKESKLLEHSFLKETCWQGKEYIGCFFPPLSTYSQLKEKEQQVRMQLQIYCPKLNLDKHSIYLFSQLFLA